MPVLVIRHPDGSEQDESLVKQLTIGRAEGNDLVLTEGGVSRQHARIFLDRKGAIYVEDLGSSNGTYVNGKRITDATVVPSGGEVVVGAYSILFQERSETAPSMVPSHADDEPRPPPRKATPRGDAARPKPDALAIAGRRPTRTLSRSSRPPGEAPSALTRSARSHLAPVDDGATLRGLTGPWANRRYQVRGKLVVGRLPGLDIELDDDSVSRRHAEVEVTSRGVVLRDLSSANGTYVNGQPLKGERPIHPGDVVQFGVVEFAFEEHGAAALAKRSHSGGGTLAEARRPQARKSSSSLGLLVVVVICLGGVVTAWKVLSPAPPPPPPVVEQPAEDFLMECRGFATAEPEPNWAKAAEACDQALTKDPINADALALQETIRKETKAAGHYHAGGKLESRNRDEEALKEYSKIAVDSYYYQRVKAHLADVVDRVKKHAEDDCKRYLNDEKWAVAAERCDVYFRYACPQIPQNQLNPPQGQKLQLEGKLKRNGWRPSNKVYLGFLKAREKANINGAWYCPASTLFEPTKAPTDAKDDMRKALLVKYHDKTFGQAMFLYWSGKDPTVELGKLNHDPDKAQLHSQVNDAALDVSNVLSLYKEGNSALQRDQLDKADQAFSEMLDLDQKLMGKETIEKSPSSFRRSASDAMAAKAAAMGEATADRQTLEKACATWKIGFRYSKADTGLLTDLSKCEQSAQRLLSDASSCEVLDRVDKMVVTPKMVERLQTRRSELHCPDPKSLSRQ